MICNITRVVECVASRHGNYRSLTVCFDGNLLSNRLGGVGQRNRLGLEEEEKEEEEEEEEKEEEEEGEEEGEEEEGEEEEEEEEE